MIIYRKVKILRLIINQALSSSEISDRERMALVTIFDDKKAFISITYLG